MKHTRKFTKTLALILSLLMMFTMIPISVSADASGEATAITDAAGFAAMTENGNYYLANNITITTTYSGTFKGTFDGNGKTVTTVAPLFKSVNGATIENLTVSGSIKGRAAVVSYVLGNTVFANITNNASVDGTNFDMEGDYSDDVTTTDTNVGGIAGCIMGGSSGEGTVKFENCTNTASVKVTESKKSSVGGILGAAVFYSSYTNAGYKANVEFINCKNEGDIVTKHNGGGIVGYVYDVNSINIDGCENSGTISHADVNTKCYSGGMAGYIKAKGSINITRCYNSGNISATDIGAGIVGWFNSIAKIEHCGNIASVSFAGEGDWLGYVAGIAGYFREGDIAYCYNTGDIKSNAYGGGIAGNIRNAGTSSVRGCYNNGKIAFNEGCTGGKLGQIFQGGNYGTLENNYYDKAQSDAGVRACYVKGSDLDNEYGIAYETADVASGKLAYDMNKSIGAQIYYQNLTDTDAAKYPTLNVDDGVVIKSGENYYSVRIETADKAAVRIDGVKTGLRVTTAVNKADYDKLMAAGISANDLTFGTVFTSDAYIKAVAEAGGVFSMASLDEFLTDVTAYVDVAVAKKGTEGFYATDADAYHFRGSLVNVAKDNLADSFSAIGYVKLGDDIVYSGYYTTVSIAEISEMAYEDRAESADTTYTQTIAANSEVAIGAVVTYSPYTEAQLTTLKGYYN